MPAVTTPAILAWKLRDLAYDAWAAAAQGITDMWNTSLDPSGNRDVPAVIRRAIQHIRDHSSHRNRDDADRAERAYRRGQVARARQRQAMALVAAGWDNRAIAEKLDVTADALRQDLSRAYRILVPDLPEGRDLRTTAVLVFFRHTRGVSVDPDA